MDRLPRLDGLRGVAALVVFLHHFALVFYPAVYLGLPSSSYKLFVDWFYALPFGFLLNGNFAVQVFFVLSGFVLCASQYLAPRPITANTYAQRYLRLMIPVLGSVLIAYVLLKLGLIYFYNMLPLTGDSPWAGYFWNSVPSLPEAIIQGGMRIFMPGKISWYSPVLWPMGYFWIGSVMLISYLLLFQRSRWRMPLGVVLALIFVKSNFFGFWIGALLADLYCQRNLWQEYAKEIRPWLAWAALAAVALFGSYPSSQSAFAPMYAAFVPPGFSFFSAATFYHTLAAGVLLLVVLTAEQGWSARWLERLVPLGEASYSLYLLHSLVLGSVGCWVFIVLAPAYPYHMATLGALAAVVLVLAPLTYWYWRFIEKPANHLAQVVRYL